MPVNLNAIPDSLPKQKKGNFWLWLGFLILSVALGVLGTLIYSVFYSLSNFWFICFSIIFPVSIWMFCFFYNLYIRFCNDIYIENWNIDCEIERQELIEFARRGLYVLSHSLETHHGKQGSGVGVANNKVLLSSMPVVSGRKSIAYSSLAIPESLLGNYIEQRLKAKFDEWKLEYQTIFNRLSPKLNIHVRLFIDSEPSIDNLEDIWTQTLGKLIKPTSFEIKNPKNSTLFTESWLDHRDHDSDLLIVIAGHLFQIPSENEGEFLSFMLFAGEEAINDPCLSDFRESAIKVYRSEQTQTLEETIDKALLWGDGKDKDYDGIWTSFISEDQNKAVLNHLNIIDFKPNNFFSVDNSIGKSGNCALWLVTGLAIEQALDSKNKQFILIGQPELTASVVAYPQLS